VVEAADASAGRAVKAVLLTQGDPGALTGGSLYHRRIAERSRRFGVDVDIRPLGGGDDPRLAARGADVVVVDSIVASSVRPDTLGRPVVASVQQRPGGLTGHVARRAARSVLDRRCYRRASIVVVPSAFLASQLERAGVPAWRVRVVTPGCSAPVAASPESRPTRARTRVAFASVANVSAHKRPVELLDAFARIADLDASLVLVGGATDARLAERLERRLARPDLAGRARWLGPLSPGAVATVLASSDVFVLPALHEAYGMAVAEAMRAGLPAIVARSGNLPTLVRDGVDGIVVRPGDTGALAAAMRRLADEAPLRRVMGAAARLRAEGFPSWEDAAERFCAALRAAHAPGAPTPVSGCPTSAA
jgi:glycosyltransferase involved in cell wall biosynthesis